MPIKKFRDKGVPIDNLGNYDSSGALIIYLCAYETIKNQKLLFVTSQGMMKIVDTAEFDVAKRTIAATKLAQDDELVFVGSAGEMEQVVFQSNGGYFLRFLKQEISTARRAALGVRGMKLAQEDYVEHAYLLSGHQEYAISYHDREYPLNKVRLGKRDTRGIKPRS